MNMPGFHQSYWSICVWMLLALLVAPNIADIDRYYGSFELYKINISVNVTINAKVPVTNKANVDGIMMRNRMWKQIRPNLSGHLVAVESRCGGCRQPDNTACTPLTNTAMIPRGQPWVALVSRGKCSIATKLTNVYNYNVTRHSNSKENLSSNVSAVLLLETRRHSFASNYETDLKGRPLYLWINHDTSIFDVLFNKSVNTTAQIYVTVKGKLNHSYPPYRESILFVSISFILLMIISFAWLIFYYVQRFRYIHAKERLTRRLANAAKKALARIPERSLKSGDQELENENVICAICIESYAAGESVRVLPCLHVFHKICVDPWLLDQRSCPICKMDILKALDLWLDARDISAAMSLMSTLPTQRRRGDVMRNLCCPCGLQGSANNLSPASSEAQPSRNANNITHTSMEMTTRPSTTDEHSV